MTPVPHSSPPSSGIRPRSPVFLLALPFLASVLGSWAWFNTDLGRPQARDQKSGVRSDLRHLSSGTDLRPPSSEQTGYTFVEKPVSDEVKKILGTTNILNGTFHKIGGRSSEIGASNQNEISSRPRLL